MHRWLLITTTPASLCNECLVQRTLGVRTVFFWYLNSLGTEFQSSGFMLRDRGNGGLL